MTASTAAPKGCCARAKLRSVVTKCVSLSSAANRRDEEGRHLICWVQARRKDGDGGSENVEGDEMDSAEPDARPRRLQVDFDGIVWFAEVRGGKIGRFDPKTETFREYRLPGAEPTPYALAIDQNHYIWYSSDHQDVIGRLDPKTGRVIEYPFTHSEISMREFFLDSQGRMWFASARTTRLAISTLSIRETLG
jgi:streptogramin lyase